MDIQREKEIESIFLKLPFLIGLSEGERSEIRKHIMFRDFRRNKIILHEEDTSNCFLEGVQFTAE
jgi:hypothetical protein